MIRCKPRENGYERVWDNVETNLNPRRGEGPGQECERMDKLKGKKTRVTRKECKRLREEFEVGVFMAQRGSRNIPKKRMLEDRGSLAQRRRRPAP